MNAIQEVEKRSKEESRQHGAVALTPAQEKAVSSARNFVRGAIHKEEFVFSGLAGTGKTTSAVELIGRLKDDGYRIAVCTPTGKAAHVLNTKQNIIRANTLHKTLTKRPLDFLAKIHERLDELELESSLRELTVEEKAEEESLFHELAIKKKDGNHLSFEPIDIEDFEYNLLIFDESSMIGRTDHYDKLIERIPCPKIFIGDGAQLPPVKDTPGVNFRNPDAHLTEILRQGKDSGILSFAHMIHKGKVMRSRDFAQYDDLTVIPSDRMSAIKDFAKDHQIITWTNPDRYKINPIVREIRGFISDDELYPHWPLPGEHLMIHKNDEDLRLLRGQLFKVLSVQQHPQFKTNPYLAWITFLDDEGIKRPLPVSLTDMTPYIPFINQKGVETPLISGGYDKNARRLADKFGVAVRWPYAITAHTSQGSEWDNVYVYGGGMMPEGREDYKQWWYTAATRARKSLVVASSYWQHN